MTTAQQLGFQAGKAREATARRDELIVQMREEGASLRAIGEAAGMTAPGVARVLKRQG